MRTLKLTQTCWGNLRLNPYLLTQHGSDHERPKQEIYSGEALHKLRDARSGSDRHGRRASLARVAQRFASRLEGSPPLLDRQVAVSCSVGAFRSARFAIAGATP